MKPMHIYLPLNKPKFKNKSKSVPFFKTDKLNVLYTG